MEGRINADNLKQQVIHYRGQDSSVYTVTGWMAKVQFPARARGFYFFHNTQTGSGACPSILLSNGY
jgi:hypothetical protein